MSSKNVKNSKTYSLVSTEANKRGTVNLGYEYESLLPAYIALQLLQDKTVKSFFLELNLKRNSKFDDLFVSITKTDEQTENFALQLKHKDVSGKLDAKSELGRKGTNVYIGDYLQEVNRLPEDERSKCKFILFTNVTYENYEKIKYYKIKKIGCENFRTVFFEDNVFNIEDTFFLMTGQKNVEKLIEGIKGFFLDASTAACYKDFFREFHNGTYGKAEITRDEIILKLADLMLEKYEIGGSIIDDKMGIVKQAIQNFDITMVRNPNLIKLCEEERDLPEKLVEKAMRHKIISTKQNLTKNKKLQILNFLEEEPWFLLVNQHSESVIKRVVYLCNSMEAFKIRFVLVGDDIVFEEPNQLRKFSRLHDLQTFDSPIYEEIINNTNISIQGRPAKSIKSLKKEYSVDIDQFISLDDILDALDNNNCTLIGTALESLPKPYIERRLSRTPPNIKLLKRICAENMTILRCDNRLKTPKKFLKHVAKDINVLHTSDIEEPNSYFAKLCLVAIDKQVPEERFRNLLRLKLTQNNNLEWIESQLNPDMQEIFKFQVNAVCGKPGIGKTTLMKYIANKCPLDYWVVPISLKQGEKKMFKMEQDVECFLLNFLDKKSRLGRDLSEYLKKKKKFMFFFDGLDELSNNYIPRFINMVEELRNLGHKIWISCTEQSKNILVELDIYSIFEIEYLTKEDQELYIHQKLQSKPNVEKFFQSNIKQMGSNVLKLPLYLYILTEIINEDSGVSHVEEITTVTRMYSRFINGQLQHNLKKTKYKNEADGLEIIVNVSKHFYIKECQIGALKSCLEPEIFNSLKLENDHFFIEEIKNKGDFLRLIVEITEDGSFIFTHNSFAKYFAALWLSEHFEKIPEQYRSFIFLPKYSRISYFFNAQLAEKCPLHLAILNQDLPQVVELAPNHLNDKDRGGRTPLHLASALEVFDGVYKKCENEKMQILEHLLDLGADPLKTDNLFGLNSFGYADRCQSLSTLEKLALEKTFDMKYLKTFQNFQELAVESAKFGYLNILKRLFHDKGKSLFDETESNLDESMLHLAIENNHREIAKLLIRLDIGLEKADCRNRTALHKSAIWGDCEIIDLLLKRNLKIDARDFEGRTPLHLAAKMGHKNAVGLLLDNGTAVDVVDTVKRRTPLHKASYMGKTEVVEFLIENGAEVNRIDDSGKTPIQRAAEMGHCKTVEFLISKNADVNITDKNMKTPLHYAVFEGHENVVSELVKGSCYVSIEDEDGKTALELAGERGYTNIVNILQRVAKHKRSNSNDATNQQFTIAQAAKEGNLEEIKSLVQQGINIENTYGEYDETILHIAAFEGHEELVSYLLDQNASSAATNSNGRVPLHLAAIRGHLGIVQKLLKRGQDNISDRWGISPIQKAAYKGHGDVVEAFLNAGVGPNCRSSEGGTVLHSAARGGHLDLLEMLISLKADITIRSNSGKTCLHVAAQRGCTEAVVLLLEKRNNFVNEADNRQRTALHWAAERGYLDMVKKIVDAGADINLVDDNNQTALDIAKNLEGKEQIVEFLESKLSNQV